MKINHLHWSLKTANSRKEKIDPSPQYQRGAVWSRNKSQLLIDSILRGYDVPKIYFRRISMDGMYDYEVADGQQRLRAIWGFYSGEFSLGECKIDSDDLSGRDYFSLQSKYQEKFDKYVLNIVELEEATNDEVRTLFARLQMGVVLNPAELRNAITSSLGSAIHMLALNHSFFDSSRISSARFKHDDYLAHVIALIHYNGSEDIKAKTLERLYKDLSDDYPKEYFKIGIKVLDWMKEVNALSGRFIKNKWTFVDIFWFLYQNYNLINQKKLNRFTEVLLDFETLRKKYSAEPEDVLSKDRDLYDYIVAYKSYGALAKNIQKRNRVFNNKFLNTLN